MCDRCGRCSMRAKYMQIWMDNAESSVAVRCPDCASSLFDGKYAWKRIAVRRYEQHMRDLAALNTSMAMSTPMATPTATLAAGEPWVKPCPRPRRRGGCALCGVVFEHAKKYVAVDTFGPPRVFCRKCCLRLAHALLELVDAMDIEEENATRDLHGMAETRPGVADGHPF